MFTRTPNYTRPGKAVSTDNKLEGLFHAVVTRSATPKTITVYHDAIIGSASAKQTLAADAILGSPLEAEPKNTVFVRIPRLSSTFEYGPIQYIGAAPSVGDNIYVGFKEGRQDELVAITSPSVAAVTEGVSGDGLLDPTIVVAAANAKQSTKDAADYVCDGLADEVEIQAAIDYVLTLDLRGARIVLSEGDFNVSDNAHVDTTLSVITGPSTGESIPVHLHGMGTTVTTINIDDSTDVNNGVVKVGVEARLSELTIRVNGTSVLAGVVNSGRVNNCRLWGKGLIGVGIKNSGLVENCQLFNWNYGIEMGYQSTVFSNMIYDNNYGLDIKGGFRVMSVGNLITANTAIYYLNYGAVFFDEVRLLDFVEDDTTALFAKGASEEVPRMGLDALMDVGISESDKTDGHIVYWDSAAGRYKLKAHLPLNEKSSSTPTSITTFTQAGSWEDVPGTLTAWTHTTDTAVDVQAWGQGTFVEDVEAAVQVGLRLQVSLNNGSSWTTGSQLESYVGSSNTVKASISPIVHASGTATNNVLVKLQYFTNHLNLNALNGMEIIASVTS